MSEETTTPDADEAAVATEDEAPKLPDLAPEVMRVTRLYELCILFDPSEATRTWPALSEWVSEMLTDKYGAHVYRVDKWADSRRLAYEINGLRRGTYMVVWFRAKPAILADLDREVRLDERSARHMIVHHEFEPPTVGMSAEDFDAGRSDDRDERSDRGDRDRGDRGGRGGGRKY